MAKVSVLVPVYGVEKYIEKCIRSLMTQTLDDIEFVIVNDCTKDKSMEILFDVISEYPHLKENIKIINNEQNKGLAYTRSISIKAASGDYIIYCDSDDWVEPDFCECLYKKALEEDADIVACNYFESLNGNQEQTIKTTYHTQNPRQAIRDIYKNPLPTFGCMHLMKRSLFVDNNILPFEGINSGEDLNVVFRIMFFAKKLAHVEKPLYHYQRRSGSLTLTTDYMNLWNRYLKKNINGLEQFVSENNAEEEFRTTINYLKFQKKMFLLAGDKPELKLWWKAWPESNKDIYKFTSYPLKTRIIFKICSTSYLFLLLYFKVIRKFIG